MVFRKGHGSRDASAALCVLCERNLEQQQQPKPFYGPLIPDNLGEPVPETTGHINPRYHHYPPQYL